MCLFPLNINSTLCPLVMMVFLISWYSLMFCSEIIILKWSSTILSLLASCSRCACLCQNQLSFFYVVSFSLTCFSFHPLGWDIVTHTVASWPSFFSAEFDSRYTIVLSWATPPVLSQGVYIPLGLLHAEYFQTRCWTWSCRYTVVCEMLCNGLP